MFASTDADADADVVIVGADVACRFLSFSLPASPPLPSFKELFLDVPRIPPISKNDDWKLSYPLQRDFVSSQSNVKYAWPRVN